MIRHVLSPLALLILAAPVLLACTEAELWPAAMAEEGEDMQLVTPEATRAECGACHMAYPAGFLPARSWTAIMGGLDDHFGENAELDEATRAEIEAYLVANAADAGGRRSGFLRNLAPDATPLRITEMLWFTYVHGGEVPSWMRERAGSMSNCEACHRGADR